VLDNHMVGGNPRAPAWAVLMMVLAAIAAVLFFADAIEAQDGVPPIPADQWTPETRVTLARCVVGEAGWVNSVEHVEIASALANRWRAMLENGHGSTFKNHIVQYCKALQSSRKWLLEMNGDGTVPRVIERRADDWRTALATIDKWAAGEIHAACKLAEHWAGKVAVDRRRAARAVAAKKWHASKCHGTSNKFYGVNRGRR